MLSARRPAGVHVIRIKIVLAQPGTWRMDIVQRLSPAAAGNAL